MTASHACRYHNVWLSKALVSASRLLLPPPRPPHWTRTYYHVNDMSDDERLLGKSDLQTIFESIDQYLVDRGRTEEVVIGGGSAMIYLWAGRSTDDIDVLTEEINEDVANAVLPNKHTLLNQT